MPSNTGELLVRSGPHTGVGSFNTVPSKTFLLFSLPGVNGDSRFVILES